jgi:hypothetical protein
MTPEKRHAEQIAAEIEATVAKLNQLAADLPVDMYVQFFIGEIMSPRQNVNGYITARVHRFEL